MAYQEYQKIVDETSALLLLEENKADWEKRYSDYANIITENLGTIKSNRGRLHEWEPFKFYLNTTNAKQAKNSVRFDMRYLGQIVAEITCSENGVTLSTKSYEEKNLTCFDYDKKLSSVAWRGKEAEDFRKHFRDRLPVRNKTGRKSNEEHRLESLLLSEFLEKSGDKKALKYIQPVTIGNIRFPMPTPIRASNKVLKYSGQSGGNIDIFARVGTGGPATYLCVIELKDENVSAEQASDAIKQAIKYAVFIRELLRSKAGAQWWNLFGFGGEIPKKLVVHAVCAMPYIENADTSFGKHILQIGKDKIQLQYIYFKETSKIEVIKTSFSYGKANKSV